MRYILCLLLLLSSADAVHGQGFNVFNGRNHPELEWQVAETEHFRIVYPAPTFQDPDSRFWRIYPVTPARPELCTSTS